MDPLDLLLRQAGGFATTRELHDEGFTARHLRGAISSGSVQRVRQGLYAVVDAPADGVVATSIGGRLAGISAASTYDIWAGWDRRLHVAVPRNSTSVPPSRRADGVRRIAGRRVVVHWGDDRRDGQVWRVSPGRAVAQILRRHDWETAAAAVESALTAGALRAADLPRLALGLPADLATAVCALEAGAQSGLETIVRLRLEALGYRVVRQAAVAAVGHVDLRITGTRVLIEIDGYEYHSGLEAFTEDRRRDVESASQGLIVLRFTAGHVRHRWAWMERKIIATIAATSF